MTNLQEKAMNKQIGVVGSKEIYKRVNNKLANLEVDHFFYREQLKLYEWRHDFLRRNNSPIYSLIGPEYGRQLAIVITQNFDQVLSDWGPGEFSNIFDEENNRKALDNFYAPLIVIYWLNNMHDQEAAAEPCQCLQCEENVSKLKPVLHWAPRVVPIVELAMRSYSRQSGCVIRLHSGRRIFLRMLFFCWLIRDCMFKVILLKFAFNDAKKFQPYLLS